MTDKTNKPEARHAIEVGVMDQRTYEEPRDITIARKLTRPEVQAASVIQRFEGDNHEVNALVVELAEQIAAVNRGE